MKKLLITLLLGLTLHKSIKTDDVYAFSLIGYLDDTNVIETSISNTVEKVFLHTVNQVTFGIKQMETSDAYIKNENGVTKIYNVNNLETSSDIDYVTDASDPQNGLEVNYKGIIITQEEALKNGLKIPMYQSSYILETTASPLYLKVKLHQSPFSDPDTKGTSRYSDATDGNPIPLGLTGFRGYGDNLNTDLYIQVYASAE